MLSKITSGATVGLEATLVDVEVDIAGQGLPSFMLVAASNPCPCGYFDDPKRACRFLPGTVSRYQRRISGPILDQIDFTIDVPSSRGSEARR